MAAYGERRQRIRHKLHTPVYASFSASNRGMVLDLSELLDLHEEGFAVQTAENLAPNRAVNVCLDLPETKSYVHGTGHVVWSDASGRAGIRFSGLLEPSQRLLKEWLFVNLLIAATNHHARNQQLAHLEEEGTKPVPELNESGSPAALAVTSQIADLSGLMFALEAVRRELHACEDDFNATLQLLVERAMSLTGATGAALAFVSNSEMVCRATAGEPAPPVDSIVDVKRGISGECVRSARTTLCEDSETDSLVDREVCRVLGIRSVIATPILSDFRVVGLLEVLSPNPRIFARIHEIVLERLAEIAPKTEPKPPARPPSGPASSELPTMKARECEGGESAKDESSGFEIRTDETISGSRGRRVHFGLLVTTVALAALALGYVLAPTIERHWLVKPEKTVQAASADTPAETDRQGSGPLSFEALHKLAEQGDAEAQWNLGARYHNGEGVPQDDSTAVEWFQRAAEQGNVAAQAALAAYYWAGRGVPQDLSKAYFWSALAVAQGDDASKSRMEGLASQMTRPQILAARQKAEEWIRQHAQSVKQN